MATNGAISIITSLEKNIVSIRKKLMFRLVYGVMLLLVMVKFMRIIEPRRRQRNVDKNISLDEHLLIFPQDPAPPHWTIGWKIFIQSSEYDDGK